MTALNVTAPQPPLPFVENGARITRARSLIHGHTGQPIGKEKFAALVGTTRRHMIRLENGEHLPSGELRDRIVEVTGTDEQIQAFDDDEEEEDSLAAVLNEAVAIMSQGQRILKLLRARPHTTAEILAAVPCIVHSRIADLRGQGHDITCEQIGPSGADSFLYTLNPPLRERPATDGAGRLVVRGEGDGSLPSDDPFGSSPAVALSRPEQLTLEAA